VPPRPPVAEWFEDESFWESVYPLTFPPERFTLGAEEVGQALRLAQVTGGAALDLCCGPGRHAVPLARHGFRVTAVDRSPFLLARARERAAAAGAEIEFVQEDMRRFVRADAFDLALNLFTSFGYFSSRDDDLTVLRGVHASLRPGGVLVMDLMGKEPLARHFQPTRSRVLDDGTLLVERTQILADWARVRADWVASRHGRARTLTFTLTLYSGQELRALLGAAGFGLVRLHGSLDGRPYDLDAQRLVAVARKTVD
jgi:SAM-dependent methyltransferase